MKQWVESAHCKGRLHCNACRNDAHFRQKIVDAGRASERDFACPIGLPIGKPVVGIARVFQPGDILTIAIKQITGKTPCGACLERKAQMNEWGWLGCWNKRTVIIGWLCDEAVKRGHPITPARWAFLFRAALRELRPK